jgi:HPr kinase/phosphorylase
MTTLIHATAVIIDGHGVMITGPSGSGKSDLALRLIDRGAVLVCDDQVGIDSFDGTLMISQAPNISGKLEVRGVGIVPFPVTPNAPLRMIVALDRTVERLPDGWEMETVHNYHVPLLPVAAFAASAPIKVELGLTRIIDEAIMPVAAGSAPRYSN